MTDQLDWKHQWGKQGHWAEKLFDVTPPVLTYSENVGSEKNDQGKVATGVLYIDTKAPDLYETLNAIDKPLNTLNEKELCPGSDKLKTINQGLNQFSKLTPILEAIS